MSDYMLYYCSKFPNLLGTRLLENHLRMKAMYLTRGTSTGAVTQCVSRATYMDTAHISRNATVAYTERSGICFVATARFL